MKTKTIALACTLILALSACHEPPRGAAGRQRLTSNVTDWRDEVIYQVVVDRFADGDFSNNYNTNRHSLGRYQGGDWRGLVDRIPYFKELGITTLWISPVVKNLEQDAGFSGYHGYWTQDFLRVNPHFGDMAALQNMVDRMHDNGIKVILDIVVNHIGQLWYYDMNRNGRPDDTMYGGGPTTFGSKKGSKPKDIPGNLTRISEWDPDFDSRGVQAFTSLGESGPAPLVWIWMPEINRVPALPKTFQNPAWYHRNGRVTVWENKPKLGTAPCETAPGNNLELCAYVRKQEVRGDFPGGLKDLATERPEVRKELINVFQYWIEVGDFDGLRIDTLKHVEHDFWKEFCPAMRRYAKQRGKDKFFMFGEAFTGADRLLAEYVKNGQVDSLVYFSQKYRIDEVFKNGGATTKLKSLHEDRVKLYQAKPHPDGITAGPSQVLVNFLDNHDVSRFLFKGKLESLHAALSYLVTTVGIPGIYYGTEQQFFGGNDPANREVMWRGNPAKKLRPFDTENATFKHLKRLLSLRKQHAMLRRGDFKIRWATDHTASESDTGIFAYERTYQGKTALVVINAAQCSASRKASRSSYQGSAMPSAFARGTALRDVLGGKAEVTVGPGGAVDVEVPCSGALILLER